ncbi:MAG: hypothetical protein B7Z71_00505 [Acidocella sp. 21-58-7]|nr:MAG: hypothetical protein B7Z71_00505 [Acidocella sp. 21-58-7]
MESIIVNLVIHAMPTNWAEAIVEDDAAVAAWREALAAIDDERATSPIVRPIPKDEVEAILPGLPNFF